MNLITDWFRRTFADPQAVILSLLLLIGFGVIFFLGGMLAPVLASLVIAYLLEGLVTLMERRHVPRLVAVLVVFSAFVAFVTMVFFVLLPLLSQQVSQLVQQLPSMIAVGQESLMQLPERYPEFVSPMQIEEIIAAIGEEIASFGKRVLSMSLSSVVGFITIVIYLILMPLLVFFFLKDKHLILRWFSQFLPPERPVAARVWEDVDRQIANYVRGKFWEIITVWSVSYVTFSLFGLQYAMLLAVLVGLSVIIPYIGAAVVTFPVLVIAWFQWGWGPEFVWLTVAYLVIQALDGNVLVPLLFSEVVNLHPVAIIVAILVFGGLWGFWGVFFAIPLATVVQAVIRAWPSKQRLAEEAAPPA